MSLSSLRTINKSHMGATLASPWLDHHLVRITQKHLQLGQHFHVDLDAILVRLATLARTRQPAHQRALEFAHPVVSLQGPAWVLTGSWSLSPEHTSEHKKRRQALSLRLFFSWRCTDCSAR